MMENSGSTTHSSPGDPARKAASGEKTRVLVIAGPTAVGKTGFAIRAARHFGGEIVSCDSMQVYRFMDIGSAKPTREEREAVPHHLIDFVDPGEEFSAAKYADLARSSIGEIAGRGKLPIVCGGTGLYLNGILYEMDFGEGPKDPELRRRLEARAEAGGGLPLHEELSRRDPEAAARIHPNNVKKVIRALERLELGEGGLRDFHDIAVPNPALDPVLIGLSRERAELYARIDERVDRMIGAGLAAEVQGLLDRGLSEENISMLGIGYKEMLPFLRGETTLEEAAERIKRNTRRFAKRQFTWFRRYDTMRWLNISDYPSEEEAGRELIHWLENA